MDTKIQYWFMLILGAVCIGLIVWFLLSENSPLNARTTQLHPITQISTNVDIEIKRSDESYWSNFTLNDTLKSGDMIRSVQAGHVVFNIGDFAYVEFDAPFEIGISNSDSNSPAEFELNSGTIQYFYSFESPQIPIAVSTPDGKFIVNELSNTSNSNREFIITNSSGDLRIMMISGSGSWIENGQNAIVNSGEILERSSSTNELFKSPLPNAGINTISVANSTESDSIRVEWSLNDTTSSFKYRVFEILDDTLKLTSIHFSSDNFVMLPRNIDNQKIIQVTPLYLSRQSGSWSAPNSLTTQE